MPNALSDTIAYISPFCRYQSPNVGTNNMPIIGIANVVRNIILAAPFTWAFNRNADDSITTVNGTQDYSSSILDFAFLEKTSVQDTDGKIYELKDVKNNESLGKSTTKSRPEAIAVESYGATPITPTLSSAIKTSFTATNFTNLSKFSFTVPQSVISGDTLVFALETSNNVSGTTPIVADSLGNVITLISSISAPATPTDTVATQLGVASAYAILAAAGITNTGATLITGGHVGSSPTATETGFTGANFTPPAAINNAGAAAAQSAALIAYNFYTALSFTSLSGSSANLSVLGNGSTASTYIPGNYSAGSSMDIPTSITMDAQGNPNALFVFKAGSTLTLESGASILLVNGAQAENIVWIVGSSATTVGVTGVFNGNILANTSITLGGGTFNGRALAGIVTTSGAVTIATAVSFNVTSSPSIPDDHQFLVYNMPVIASGTSTITVTPNPPVPPMPPFASLTLTQVTVSGTTATYLGTITGGGSNALAGQTYLISGFTNAGNNVSSFLVTSSTATTLVGAFTTQVNETHAATATSTLTSRNFIVEGVLLTGVGPIQLTSPVNNTGTGTTWASQPITTALPNEVLISFTAAYNPPTSVTGAFSLIQSAVIPNAGGTVNVQLSTADLMAVAPGTYTSNWSQGVSAVWQTVIVGYPTLRGLGNLSPIFRFSAVPDKAYPVNLIYQKKPIQFVALTDSWAPIPDSFSDVYNNLCLGYYMESCQDPRAPQYVARGIAGLLARAQGLSQMDKAIFSASYMNLSADMMLNQLKTQQGQQAQGSR